jgi:hypothetical protein
VSHRVLKGRRDCAIGAYLYFLDQERYFAHGCFISFGTGLSIQFSWSFANDGVVKSGYGVCGEDVPSIQMTHIAVYLWGSDRCSPRCSALELARSWQLFSTVSRDERSFHIDSFSSILKH